MKDRTIRQELLETLKNVDEANEALVYKSVRDILLRHSVFEQQQDDTHSLSDFAGLTDAIESSVLLAKTDSEGRFLKVNDNFHILTGYSAEDLIGQPISMLSVGLHEESFLMELWDKISHGTIWRGEVKKRAKSGEIIWFNTTILPVVDQLGKIQHFISLYIDISKRKKAEGDLEMFLQMVDLTNDAIQVAREDAILVYVNERASTNLGWSREELIGKSVIDLELLFKTIDDWMAHVEEVKSHQKGMLVEGINIRVDGTQFPVEVNARWLELGGIGYIVAVLRDISERKDGENRILRTQNILNEAQTLARIASFEVDLDKGTILHSDNAWEVFGFPNSESFNIENLAKHIHAEDVDRVRNAWFEASAHSQTIRVEFRVVDLNNDTQNILGIAKTITQRAEHAGTMICTAQNITHSVASRLELEQRTWELEIRNSELDQFAQIVSHDLKSPLRAIHNLSEWIKESRGKDEKEMDAHIELLQSRIQRMENLINGILNYSSAGKIRENESYFSVFEVLNDICESHRTSGSNAQIILDSLPDLVEDRLIFEQVFSNLISNAIKHNTNPKPEVLVRYEFIPGMHRFFVEDNGPGIDPRFHKRVFQIFQTLTSRDKQENTGVGLAIVKKLCDEKGWKIHLSSSNTGGACFCIVISQF